MPAESEPPPSALDWPRRSGTADLLLQELAARTAVRRRRRRRTASAATLISVLALGAGALWPDRSAPASAPSQLVETAERTTQQTLPDGSLIEAREGAQFTTDFSGTLRRVELTRGTAHFQVMKNPARPFVVSAGGVAVRAVGTAFSVELSGRVVEVLVTEGRVAVEPSAPAANDPAKQLATVDAGAGVVLELGPVATGATPVVRPVPAATIGEKLSWRSRQLELSGTSLAAVIALLNRHAAESGQPGRFVIADPEIAAVRLSGVIRTDRTDALLHLLEAECGVRAERQDDGRVVLHRAR